MNDLKPDEFGFGGYLFTLGISCKYTTEKSFHGETVALSGGTADHFSDGELECLFRDNNVILEGGAAVRLIARGLGRLIGAESCEIMRPEIDPYSFEGARDGVVIGGIKGRRASAFRQAGEYVRIAYTDEPCLLTDLYDYRGHVFGPGIARGEGFLLIPYRIGATVPMEQFNHLRTLIIEEFTESVTHTAALTHSAGVSAYLYAGENRKTTILLANATESRMERIRLTLLGAEPSRIFEIDRESGCMKPVSFRRQDDELELDLCLDSLSTRALILE